MIYFRFDIYSLTYDAHTPSLFPTTHLPSLTSLNSLMLTVLKFCCVGEEHRFIEMLLLNPLQAHLC